MNTISPIHSGVFEYLVTSFVKLFGGIGRCGSARGCMSLEVDFGISEDKSFPLGSSISYLKLDVGCQLLPLPHCH